MIGERQSQVVNLRFMTYVNILLERPVYYGGIFR